MFGDLVEQQCGVISRRQVLASGMSDEAVEANIAAGRWQRLLPGVYATFTGPVPRRSQLWAAVLRAGRGAMLSHETAAELVGLTNQPSAAIHVTVPAQRTLLRIPGVVVHRSVRADLSRHPSRIPPQTRVEDTIVDLTQTARCLDDAMGWLARAVGARATTAQRLSEAMQRRSRLRWRGPLHAAIDDARRGCHSLLELTYLRKVERDHGLPAADRQVSTMRTGRGTYDDVAYREYATVVELDGRAAHPDPARWRDMRRDNAAVVNGMRSLRYGYGDVDQHPCRVAAQVATVLRAGGWTGRPRRCGRSDCVVP